jgi:hypothetical protein
MRLVRGNGSYFVEGENRMEIKIGSKLTDGGKR